MKKLVDFLANEIIKNREGKQSSSIMKEVEKLANKYLTKEEKEKFYNKIYKS
ncbi:MAG: hypothetical protein IT232_08595 [Flavobacteriales bacterium]|nr:hypothetical protein [Flavobacteriales bacterium]